MITFAGIPLPDPFPSGILPWAGHVIPPEWEHDVPRRATPFGEWPRHEPIAIPRLDWPIGASRFGLGYYVVDGQTLAKIRRAVMPGGVRRPGTLAYELAGERRTLETEMYALPARPLQQSRGQTWHLLPLVDARYFWWEVATDLPEADTWEDLFSGIADALGISLAVDPVPDAYLSPPAWLSSAYPSLPLLLDACCATVGARFVRQLNGDCRVWRPENSLANQRDQVRLLEADRMAGGAYALVSP